MGSHDYYESGDWNSQCFECGTKYKSSELKKHWQGYYVCERHWEPRQPQDFVKGVVDNISVPWSQPENSTFITIPGIAVYTAIVGFAVVGYSRIGFVPEGFDPTIYD